MPESPVPDVKFSKSKLEILKVASSPRGDWKSARQLPSKTTIRGGTTMAQVAVVTDSTADIPAAERERLGIEMVPLKVHFGEETYLDNIDLTPEQFYQKLKAFSGLPTTSQPS